MDVPRFLPGGLGAETERVPYLAASAGLMSSWRSIDEVKDKRKVGLVWAGNPGHGRDAARSLDAALLCPLLENHDTVFYSIRKGAQDLSALPPGSIIDLGGGIKNFADTAAIVQHLDLVITVDTSVAHLAGAMGKTVWTMITHMPDWRWGLTGEATAWYPSMRLFRQPRPGDWKSVVAAIGRALAAL